ncbi:MAG TPA: PAC2 family protein [Acidimicrobiales bacterium]|jgi:predicted ATP-grasp superfamily ATP-dependent carboligase|nr:PAC2 family protein [Acidimicrobiales bacterium]
MTESGTPIYTVDPDWGQPIGARLTSPVLVVSLEGWVDAGLGASTAVAELVGTSATIPVASFDTEVLIDQRARRPIAQLVNGITTEVTWPSIQVIAGTDGDGADVLYLVGPEPDFRWKSFLAAVVELVQQLGVRMVVGLGAFPAPAPHTRPVRLASTVPPQSADLAGRVGFVQGTLEVPAGVQAALEMALGAVNVPVISLWARVPHYVAAMPFPEASAALINGLCAVSGLVFDTTAVRKAAAASRRQVDELIADNTEHADMVRRLESSIDSEEANPLGIDIEVPSGDEIAAELERFLRDEGS